MKIKKTSLGWFIVSFLALAYYTQPLILEFGWKEGIILIFLCWSFFVLCIPVSRGKVILGLPISLFTKKEILTEKFTWPIAAAGNVIVLIQNPDIYFKSYLTILLYNILTKPYPYIIIPIMCLITTFYTGYFCAPTRGHIKLTNRFLCTLLIFSHYIITFILTYQDIIIILNTHGRP